MGWTYGSSFEYDLILLDIVLPKLDGMSLCKRFRAEGYMTPIILLTDQGQIIAKVAGLDAGADDYVVKPFNMAELSARIRAVLRRSIANPSPVLTWGDLFLNLSTCEVTYNGQPLVLTTKEYELLELLLRDSQHVLSTDEILDRLWSSEEFPSEATVRSHIRRVRQKLGLAGAPADFISTVHGRGYYLKVPSDQQLPDFSPTNSMPMLSSPVPETIKVMIVDDDKYWLNILSDLLHPWNFKITTLADPQQFWIVLQSVVPDVLILDANLSVNSMELCQALRNDTCWQRLVVLFLNVISDRQIENQAFMVGADDYLSKPVLGDELANRILYRLKRCQAWTA